MFGIGLPEMLVILAVALIVVGPDKLPDLARSLAKGMVELKRTMNQVKQSLTEEDDVLGEVQDELKKTAGTLQEHLLDTESRTWRAPQAPAGREDGAIDLEPVEERPWEADRLKVPPGPDGPGPDGKNDSATDADRQEKNGAGSPPAPAA
ncbi:MAG TPA: twin-arginine translocase subunit TatB [Desulfobulbus sp.]|nr:twin-arginine translocase subunit TatB [Desulfobulbus sp.]